jgi:lipopolysaccharide export system permease protein
MLGTLDRYVLREVLATWAVTTGVLFVILVADRFARDLASAAAGNLPREAVFLMLGLTSVYFIMILIPVGLFGAILLTLGRLYRDSEMAAIMASGFSPGRLYRPLFVVAVPTVAVLALLTLEIAPRAAQAAYVTSQRARQVAQVGLLEPGRFKAVSGGEIVFYAEDVDAAGRLQNVFIQRRRDDVVEVAVAASGEVRRGGDDNRRTLVLHDGQRVEGEPGTTRFREVSFREHGIPIQLPTPELRSNNRQTYATRELLGSSDPRDVAELQWRYSLPLAVFALTVLAVPLARTRPRQGRYGTMAAALLAYILYSNLLAAARGAVAQGQVGAIPGIWWVHVLVFVVGLAWYGWQSGGANVLPRWLNRGRRKTA